MAEIKKRRISEKDWDKAADAIRDDYNTRKQQRFRKEHEEIWKEVDRQVAMKPMSRISNDKQNAEDAWRSAIELGELSKASEIITADVMRLTFPTTRAWFEAHSEVPKNITENGVEASPDEQSFLDRALRALMVQQHNDFGLKGRYELSVKEALHHGSYVSEIVWDKRIKFFDGSKIENSAAPVWKPYSMWNSYPDPSPSVIGTDLYYTGTMILVDFIPLPLLKEIAKGDGFMPSRMSKVSKRKNQNKFVETDDIEIIRLKGDVLIPRSDGDIYLPNSEAWLANDILIYFKEAELPFPNVIYSGYERMDVRDPYYTSPLIKLSPMQKLTSVLANKYIDNVELRIQPPIVYDGNDPQFIMDGGPRVYPGAKNPTKGSASFQEVKIGEPEQALQGVQLMLQQLQQGTGVNAIRAGAGEDVSDKTATEIQATEAKAEIRTAEFVDKQERHALRPFLYMQHLLNLKHLDSYSFYNPEMDAPDFMRATKKDLPDEVMFEVVGSRGVLGERQRSQRVSEVTAYLLQNPMTQHIPNVEKLSILAYQDAGLKNPEYYLNLNQGEDPMVGQIKQQAQEMMQGLQEENFKLKEELAISKAVNQARIEEAQIVSQTRGEVERYKAERQMEVVQFKAEQEAMVDRFNAQLKAESEGRKADMDEIKLSLGEMRETRKEQREAVNVIDSTAAAPLESIGQAIAQMAEAIKGNNDSLNKVVETISKPRNVTLERDQNGRPVGATSTIQ